MPWDIKCTLIWLNIFLVLPQLKHSIPSSTSMIIPSLISCSESKKSRFELQVQDKGSTSEHTECCGGNLIPVQDLEMVLKWGQCADLLPAEGLFVNFLDMLASSILACWHSFAKRAWVLIIYAVGCQMYSHPA